jgi:threonine/homoserine/homoserine lactone efflux protein
MPAFHDLLIFSLAALVMVLTPGPNMIYLISRSISGQISWYYLLFGVVLVVFHMLAATFG